MTLIRYLLAALAALLLIPTVAHADTITTYAATQTIAVPPASSYAGTAGGDGWQLAFSDADVFNVFHHQSTIQVACHHQSDAAECWGGARSLIGYTGLEHPSIWLDQATKKLYIYTNRSSDGASGVVCFDTASATPDCGFTQLALDADHNGIPSNAVLIGTKWYAVNQRAGDTTTSVANRLLCWDTSTKAACAGQPFALDYGPGNNSFAGWPTTPIGSVGSRVLTGSHKDGKTTLACFDTATSAECAGSWPLVVTDAGEAQAFPKFDATGHPVGFCLPTTGVPCYDLSASPVSTPAGLDPMMAGGNGWSGDSITIGPRVYRIDGDSDQALCYDYAANATCAHFPKSLTGSSYTYTLNRDPHRPTCLWTNADGGAAQIQNFDAYTGAGCGDGPIRVLAASFVVPTKVCEPATYTSLQVLAPARAAYTNGTISFQDASANPIVGAADRPLDATGTVDLRGLNLSTATGLPQFLVNLDGISGNPGAVTIKLTWTGSADPSCTPDGATTPTFPTPVVAGPKVPPAQPILAPTIWASGLRRAIGTTWQDSTPGATNYVLQMHAKRKPWRTVRRPASLATSYEVRGVKPGKRYWFRVAAVTATGQGPWSNEASAVPFRRGIPAPHTGARIGR